MITRAQTLAKAAALRSLFEAAGAVPVDPPILQPAETLLDLYGEDIRARAYVTSDAMRGEQMLRPDFTVPVVQMHMSDGAEPARYTYAGEVFRRQEHDPDRANEFMQVGFEIFDGSNPAAADAEVFALISQAVAPLNLRAVTGDIGILMAAVEGLQTTAAAQGGPAAAHLAAAPVQGAARPLRRPDRALTGAGGPARAQRFPDCGPADRTARAQRDREADHAPARGCGDAACSARAKWRCWTHS